MKIYWEIRKMRHGYFVAKSDSVIGAASNDEGYCFSGRDALLEWLRKQMKEADESD